MDTLLCELLSALSTQDLSTWEERAVVAVGSKAFLGTEQLNVVHKATLHGGGTSTQADSMLDQFLDPTSVG